MNTKQRCLAMAAGILSAVCVVRAQDTAEYPNANPFYRANEFSIDAFGSGSLGQESLDHVSGSRIERNGRLGAGLGVNYFFTQYIGVGADGYSENTEHSFVDSTSGNLILRLPLGQTGFAPYAFGGGGYQFDNIEQSFGQAGGGLEYRFSQHVGLFADARYIFATKTDGYGLGRAGLRVNF